MASFSFIVPMCVDAEVSRLQLQKKYASLSFSFPFTHTLSFFYLLTCALLAWPHHTKEGGCIQELKPAAAADTRAKGRGRLIHRRLWRRYSRRRWLAPHTSSKRQKTRQIQGAPYVFERFSEAVLRPWVDVEMKCYHIFLTQVYTFQIP